MVEALGLRDGWVPLGLSALVAATAFTLAVLMCAAFVAQGFNDEACNEEADGFVFYSRSETWPPETICRFRDPETREVKEISVVPWEPMRWLLPGLAISVPVVLLIGLIASLLNLRREAGRHKPG